MRINVYAEEMTDRTPVNSPFLTIWTRFWLALPITVQPAVQPIAVPDALSILPTTPVQLRGPFIHHPGDDDSAAVTFWGKKDCLAVFRKAVDLLEKHYGETRK